MAKVYLIPNKDMLVPLEPPSKGFLPAEGDFMEQNVYWTRILNDGDVTIGPPPKAKKSDPAAAV